MGNEQGKLQGVPTPAGIQSMDETLQKKFAKGIQYNMKIVIRGDRNTGKTTLFHRMEGKAFKESYIPTNEIQVTSILWSYRVTNDTVKVEIWDVVDRGRLQKKSSKGLLKMFNTPEDLGDEEESGQTLDANFLDVYKGAHGVVFAFDITKQWTWKYIERELPKVPLHIPVIVLANFMDMNEHRLISRENCIAMIEALNRPDGAADVRYAECSMKNGFGLMHLHKFLSVPFLQLQQETLLQQLQVNREQMLAAMEELDAAIHSEDQNYNMFLSKLQRLAEERRGRSSSLQKQESQRDDSSISSSGPATPPLHQRAAPPTEQDPRPLGSKSQSQQQSGSITSKLSSKFSGFLGKGKEERKKEQSTAEVQVVSKPKIVSTTNIEEFVPEGSTDFLEEEEEDDDDNEEEEDSDEDSDVGNPLIAADEDLSSPEEFETTPLKPLKQEEEEILVIAELKESILTPIKVPSPQTVPTKSKQTPKPLKSALDVELTESEEENDPLITGDDENDSIPVKTQSKVTREQLFEPLPKNGGVVKRKKEGLMLQFSTAITAPPPQISSKSNKAVSSLDSQQESSDQRKREKRKKSKKTKQVREDSKDTPPTTRKERSQSAGGQSSGNENVTMSSNDPYGAIASLDAWLNSDSTNVDDFLKPKKVSKEVEVAVEEDAEEVRSNKAKKHRHKKHGDDGGGEGTTHKKKHKSHHKSRHRSIEQPEQTGNYL